VGRKDKPIRDEGSIGASLRQARQAGGFSLTEMADLLGYSRSHISNIEHGRAPASPNIKQKYEQILWGQRKY
jgi:transcriptional regulator with XRE-family HTH domain